MIMSEYTTITCLTVMRLQIHYRKRTAAQYPLSKGRRLPLLSLFPLRRTVWTESAKKEQPQQKAEADIAIIGGIFQKFLTLNIFSAWLLSAFICSSNASAESNFSSSLSFSIKLILTILP